MPIESPNDPPRPSRLIIPGAEPETESTGPSRIVLPPGVSRETPEDLPEFPRMRPLLLLPVRDGEREVLLVQDPLGVIAGQPVLSMESLAILQLLDGTVSLQDLSAAIMRESKDLRVANMVKEFVAQLDEMLMLDSPRFQRAWKAMRDAYHPLEVRQAAFEGRAYPADPKELRAFLDGHFADAEGQRAKTGAPTAAANARPRALLAPHLDPRRAGLVIARALLELGPEQATPLRVVVFGTGHQLFGDLFALTRKHFETPLGRVPCDTAFVDAIAGALGEDAYRSELAHRDEHSIEFVALYLKHRLGDRPFTIVPILVGGFHALLDAGQTPHDSEALERLLGAVRDVERRLGGNTLYVGGVDFSHVGPRFGDPPVDVAVRAEVREKDGKAIEAALRGDAEAWFTAIAEHDDSTRICGYAPTYALLRSAEPGAGRALGYEQATEPDTSFVSVAAAVWP